MVSITNDWLIEQKEDNDSISHLGNRSSSPSLNYDLSNLDMQFPLNLSCGNELKKCDYKNRHKFFDFPRDKSGNSLDAKVIIFDDFLNQNIHIVRLRCPGFYEFSLENFTNPAWDVLLLGFLKMKAVLEFDIILNNSDKCHLKGYCSQDTQASKRINCSPAVQPVAAHRSIRLSQLMMRRSDDQYTNTFVPLNDKPSLAPSGNPHEQATRNIQYGEIKVDTAANKSSPRVSRGRLVSQAGEKIYFYFYISEPDSIIRIKAYVTCTLGMHLHSSYRLAYCGQVMSNPYNELVPYRRSVSILCLDGGGILGLSSLKILERIEKEFRSKLGNPKARLADCFDMICGTSTGGIVALSLLKGMPISEMIEIWPTMSQTIFQGSRNLVSGILWEGYNINNLKTVLSSTLGSNFMQTYLKPYCFVTTTNVKHNPYELFLIRNYTHHHMTRAEFEGITDVPLWAAAWATSSAPTYLKGPAPQELEKMGLKIHREVQLCDGALKANNPTIVALKEAARLCGKPLKHFIETDLNLILSIGTGYSTSRQTHAKATNVSTFRILLNSSHLLTSSTIVHREVLQWLGDLEDTYFRFNVPGISHIQMDASDAKSFDLISQATQDYIIDEKYYDIQRLVKKLLPQYDL